MMLMPCVGRVLVCELQDTCTSIRTCAAGLRSKGTQMQIRRYATDDNVEKGVLWRFFGASMADPT